MPGTRVRPKGRPEHMPCAGHPRLVAPSNEQDVDGRDKPGHDI